MKRILTILALFVCISAHATNYYASASGSGSGCTIGSPCTLTTALTHGTGGDMILLNKGDTFTGTFTYSNSGSSGNPIIITDYGNGNNPIIDGSGSTTANVFNITGAFVSFFNITVQDNAWAGHGVLGITGTHDVAISNCYINSGYRGIHPQSCTNNITVTACYIANIQHMNTNAGPASGDGSAIQFDNCNGSGLAATGNFITGSNSTGGGDQISLYITTGTSGSYVQITGNYIIYGGLGTNGYCGIGVGDNGGGYQNVSGNYLSTTGYAGIQIAGGNLITVNGNYIYSPQVNFPGGTGSLKALSVISAGLTSTNVTAGGNFLNWTDYNGHVNNLFIASGQNTPTNWSTNTANGTKDPNAPSTIVPNPLWTGSPWNGPIFTYSSSSYTYSTGAGVSLSPINTGTTPTTWTCSPTLPTGLSINSGTGAITGTPSTITALTTYTITAINSNGTGTYQFNMTITGTIGGHCFFTRAGKLVIKWH
jgi:Putative Ig domain